VSNAGKTPDWAILRKESELSGGLLLCICMPHDYTPRSIRAKREQADAVPLATLRLTRLSSAGTSTRWIHNTLF
jgi:hypothetical protein